MNNNKAKQKLNIYKRIAVITIIAIILLCLAITTTKKSNLQKTAQDENALLIGGKTNIDISKIASNTEVNPPAVGAGMIPIKWNEATEMWEITTVDDLTWYDYSKGTFANVMLSDGYYQSELRYDMTNKELAKAGTQIQADKLGTIFTWIPRFAYSDDGDILFLKNNGVLEYNYTVENCFDLLGYGTKQLDLACTGIWIGQK